MPRTRHAALLGALFAILCAISMLQAEAMPEELAGPGEQAVPLSTGGRSGADLIIDYISASWSTAEAGDRKSVSVRLENQGTGSSTSFYWGIYLSTDTTITTSDLELDRWSRSSMSAGYTTSTMSKYVDIPMTITGGRYYIGALADITNSNSETNENNNSFKPPTMQSPDPY